MAMLDYSQLSQWLALLGQNLAIGFVAIAMLESVLAALEARQHRPTALLTGLLFGCAGLASMMAAVRMPDGVILDMRTVFVMMGGLAGGPEGALVSAAMVGAGRIFLGGAGAVAGLAGIATAALIGGAVGRRFGERVREFGVGRFGALGLCNAVQGIAWTRAIFAAQGHAPIPVSAEIAAALAFPAATALLGIVLGMINYRVWRHTQDRLLDFLDTASDLVWESDPEQRFTFVSKRYETVLGFPPEEIVGRSGVELGGRWVDDATRDTYRKAWEERRRFDGLLLLMPARDGSTKVLVSTGRPHFDRRGRFMGFRGTAADVTDREEWRNLVSKISRRVESVVGERFLAALLRGVADVLDAEIVYVGRFDHEAGTARGLRYRRGGEIEELGDVAIAGLPSSEVAKGRTLTIQSGLSDRYPQLAARLGYRVDSYAGVPLVDGKGEVIGVLSVMGGQPLPDVAEPVLKLFAARAAAELERTEAEAEAEASRRELRRSYERLATAQRVGRIGSVEADLASGKSLWSDEMYRILGLEPGSGSSLARFLDLVHPDDREAVLGLRERTMAGIENRPSEFRIIRPDGAIRTIYRESEIFHDGAGRPAKLVVTIHDVTERASMEDELRRGRDRLARAQSTGKLGSAELDFATGEVFWSDEFYRLCGLDPRSVAPDIGTFLALVHEDDRDAVAAAIETARSGGPTEPMDFRFVRPDGELLWLHREVAVTRGGDGRLERVMATFKDITERKQLEMALAAREENLKAATRHLTAAQRAGKIGSVEVDTESGRTVWSPEVYRLFGLDPAFGPSEEAFVAQVHPDDLPAIIEAHRRECEGLQSDPVEYRLVRADGDLRWMYRQAELVRDDEGAIRRIVVTHQDVTERERLRRLLSELNSNVGNLIGEDFLSSLVASVSRALGADTAFIGRFDLRRGLLRTEFVWTEGSLRSNVEYAYAGSPSEPIAAGQTVIVHSGMGERFPAFVNPHGEGYASFAGTPLFGAKGDLLGLLGVMCRREIDSTDYVKAVIGLFAGRAAAEIERLAIERDAEGSRARMAEVLTALDVARDAIIMADDERCIIYVNDSAIRLFGLRGQAADLIGIRLRDLEGEPGHRSRADEVMAALREGGEWHGSSSWTRPSDGRPVLIDSHVHRLPAGGFVLIAADASPRLRHEEEKRLQQMREAQASKLEALGNLAGGIAHDFNNLLGAILGFAQLLVKDLEPASDQRHYAERIVGASERGRSLVQQIMSFSRHSTVEFAKIDVGESITEAHELLRASLPASTRIVIDNRASDVVVLGDKGQLLQVLVNLCVNASDALAGGQGTITLTVDHLDRGRTELAHLPPVDGSPSPQGVVSWVDFDGIGRIATGGLSERDSVSISVRDTGPGIREDIRDKIFDPFFTTKSKGRGTGLGLAMVHRIVLEHGGAIMAETAEWAGTTFEVILPMAEAAPAQKRRAARQRRAAKGQEQRAAILVVDDDEAFSAMVDAALSRRGHKVQSTTDPRVALAWVKRRSAHWDILVTDQSMPHIKGQELVQSCKIHAPELRCIICTGYSSGMDETQAKAVGADGFLNKPFDVDALEHMVDALIARNAASAKGLERDG